jgi:hypothetical protein
MTVQRLLGRLEGLAATVGSKTVESEICDIVEALDDTIDRYAPKDAAAAADRQNKSTEEEALKGFRAIKAFCAARGAGTCGTCPFRPMCQAVDKPLVDWPEPEEVKPNAQ